jgi:hypothetical protein
MPPLDLGLAFDAAQLRLGVRNHDAAVERHLQVRAKLRLQPAPQADGIPQQRDARREFFRPRLAQGQKLVLRNLRVQAAGVSARRRFVQLAPLHQHHLGAALGQIAGHGTAGDAAADHQHIRVRRQALRHVPASPIKFAAHSALL